MSEDVRKKLASLREAYVKTLPSKISEIEAFWELLKTDWDKQNLIPFQRMAHNLHGTSASHGLMKISEAAEQLELYLAGLQTVESVSERQTIEKLLSNLKASLD